MARALPRFVTAKTVAGQPRYYWTLPSYYRKLGCTLHRDHDTALGSDWDAMARAAATLNGLFDEWDQARRGEPLAPRATHPAGTVDWLFEVYRQSNDWAERVSARTAPDHERTIRLLCDIKGNSGVRIGARLVTTITPEGADKLYARIRETPARAGKAERPRTAEKAVAIARHAWKVVHRLHPGHFREGVWNPWEGVAMARRRKATKPAATREQVYAFAWGALEAGHADAAAAAVICFEWLQRPENVLAGYVTWNDYRGPRAPTMIRIEHHKTGEMVLHPLEETTAEGCTLFYEEAEAVLAKVPRLGLGIVMRPAPRAREADIPEVIGSSEVIERNRPAPSGPRKWDNMSMARLVRSLRERLGLPATFTLDACRHGGMTELEEAELTDGQGRALSAHKSKAYEGYAKRTEKRALAATRKRHAHRIGTAG